jgi:hypothetical protein
LQTQNNKSETNLSPGLNLPDTTITPDSVPVTTIPLDKTEVKEIEKQIKGKNKELKTLGKEIKSRRKKRSGAVITDDIAQINSEVAILTDQIDPATASVTTTVQP